MLNTIYGMAMAMVGGVPRGGTLIYNAVDAFTPKSQHMHYNIPSSSTFHWAVASQLHLLYMVLKVYM